MRHNTGINSQASTATTSPWFWCSCSQRKNGNVVHLRFGPDRRKNRCSMDWSFKDSWALLMGLWMRIFGNFGYWPGAEVCLNFSNVLEMARNEEISSRADQRSKNYWNRFTDEKVMAFQSWRVWGKIGKPRILRRRNSSKSAQSCPEKWILMKKCEKFSIFHFFVWNPIAKRFGVRFLNGNHHGRNFWFFDILIFSNFLDHILKKSLKTKTKASIFYFVYSHVPKTLQKN